MWVFDHTLLEIALRSAIIYGVVLVGIRLTGKREVGQMTPFDLVLLLLIANAVQNAMTGPDTSLIGGIVAGGTLLLINIILNRLVGRSRGFRNFIEGTSTVLISQGKVLTNNLKKERMGTEDLLQALREHGIADVPEVALAVLEVDGSISVLKKDEMPAVPRPHHHIRYLQRK